MASLTDQLSTDMATKPVRQAPSPSTGLATALNAISKGIDVVDTSLRQSKQNKRQAAEDEYRRQEREKEATKDLIPGLVVKEYNRAVSMTGDQLVADDSTTTVPTGTLSGNVFGNLSNNPLVGQAATDTSRAVKDLGNMQTAVNQRRIPGISLKSAVNKTMLELMAKYPAQGATILATLKNAGIDSFLYQEGIDAQDEHDNRRETSQKYRDDMLRKGMETLTPELAAESSEDEIIAFGIKATNTEYNLEILGKQAEINSKAQNISDSQRKIDQEDNDLRINREIVTDAYNVFAPVKNSLNKAIQSIERDIPLAGQQKAFEQLGPRFNQLAEQYKERQLAIAINSGLSLEKQATLRASLDGVIDGVKDLWSGDFSVAKSNQKALEAVTTTLDLQTAEAMPVYFALKKMGMNPAEMLGGMSSLNPKLAKELRQEALGFTGDFGKPTAAVRLANFVALLKGEKLIEDIDPEEAKEQMPSLFKASEKFTKGYVRGSGISADTMLNTVGQIVSATRTITPGSASSSSILYATYGVGAVSVRNALKQAVKDPESNDMAEAMVTGVRAGSAQVLLAMQQPKVLTQFDTRFHKLAIDRGTGRAYVLKTGAKARAVSGGIGDYAESRGGEGGGTTRYETVPNKPPKMLQTWIDAYNTNVDNISQMNAIDPNGVKGATPLEMAKYASLGVVPKALQQQKQKERNPQAEIDKIFKGVEDALEGVTDINTPIESSGGNSRGERNNNPGNIESGPYTKSQPGYVGSDGRFAIFDTPENGRKAQENLLVKSYLAKGHNTPKKVIWRYGNDPGAGDDKNVQNYVAYVSKKLGLGPDDIIPRSKVGELAKYMREFETGNRS